MSQQNFDWLKALGLGKEDFKTRPKSENPLIWGLKNGVIDEQAYVEWASEYYQVPAIKAEFFSMALDFTLLEKYAYLYDWTPHCYPVYMWEDTLFVAGLHPHEIDPNTKICFVIAPFTALESAWQKYENSHAVFESNTAAYPLDSLEIAPKIPEIKKSTPTDHPTEKSSGPPSTDEAPDFGSQLEPVVADKNATREQTLESPPEAPAIEEPLSPPAWEAATEEQVIIPPPHPRTGAEPLPAVAPQVHTQHTITSSSEGTTEELPPPVETPSHLEVSLDFGSLSEEAGIPGGSVSPHESFDEVETTGEHDPSAIQTLDFSVIDDQVYQEPTKVTGTHAINLPAAEKQDAAEVTHTKIDDKLNNLTSATSTMHASPEELSGAETPYPEVAFDEVSTGTMKLEGEHTQTNTQTNTRAGLSQQKPAAPDPTPEAPATPDMKNQQRDSEEEDLPSLEDLLVHKIDNPPPAPGLESREELKVPALPEDDDDYTPVPLVSEAQNLAMASKAEQKKKQDNENLSENTITGHFIPEMTPEENKITDELLGKCLNLDNCQDVKSVVAHIINHLKRDYKKLMWVHRADEDLYFPKYVYGNFRMTELAWKMHINLANPNIFRVAHSSGHPYHGEVYDNPYNSKYFEWWNGGKMFLFATVYPVTINDRNIGFIAAFEKNEEFDQLGSLKKISNLISICKKSLEKFWMAQAA